MQNIYKQTGNQKFVVLLAFKQCLLEKSSNICWKKVLILAKKCSDSLEQRVLHSTVGSSDKLERKKIKISANFNQI